MLSELNRNQASASLIKDLADLYVEQYVKVQNRHPKSKENRVNLIVHELGHIPVSELNVFDVTSYMSRNKNAGVGNATINRDISALKHMLGWAVDQGLIPSNPIRPMKKLREERKLPISEERIPILEGPWLKVKDMRTAFGIGLANMPGLEKHTIQTLLGHSSLSTTERFYAFHSHRLAVQRGLTLIEGTKEEKGAA